MTVTIIEGMPEPKTQPSSSRKPFTNSPADDVALVVINGREYTQWTSLRVMREWKTIPSVFTFVCAEPGPYLGGYDALKIKPGDTGEIYLGGIKAATIAVTTRSASYDAEHHDLVISGKSRTCDLVDSSVEIKNGGSYDGQNMEQITRDLIKPHGVGLVTMNLPPIFSKPFKLFQLNPGETVFEAIARMAVLRGVDLTDDVDGNLVIGRASGTVSPGAELELGRNILSARATLDDQTDYSELTVNGQETGDDQRWGNQIREHSATIKKPNLRYGRKKTVIMERSGDSEDVKQRANQENIRNLWPQVNASFEVRGWKRDDGKLWAPAEYVSIRDEFSFPSAKGEVQLGIQSVSFNQDSPGGTTTTIECVRPDALSYVGDPNMPGGAGDPITNAQPGDAQPDAKDY